MGENVVQKNFKYGYFLQGLFYTFTGCDYHTQSNALSFEKNIFVRNV